MDDIENFRNTSASSIRAAELGSDPSTVVHLRASLCAIEVAPRCSDALLALQQDWLCACRLARKLGQRQQAIEAVLVDRIGFPCVRVPLDDGGSVTVHHVEELQAVVADGPQGTELRLRLEAALAAHQRRWEAGAAELGYAAALRAEEQALLGARELAGRLWAMPARSLAGVIAKLEALLAEGQPCEGAGEFPWPQLRAMREDLGGLDVDPSRASGR